MAELITKETATIQRIMVRLVQIRWAMKPSPSHSKASNRIEKR